LTVVERGGSPAEELADRLSSIGQHSVDGANRAAASSNGAGEDGQRAHVVGVTGAPGAGKSTLTGRLIELLVERGHAPAVLAVDPSSPLTGGAILGDRIRMDDWAAPSTAFIRSMATRGHSGGLALAVPLAVRLFDVLGFDPILIETVGVGQVEVDVVAAADTTVVVVPPGMGDAVQANKAGLLEVADVFAVNKADRPGANDVRRDLELMLDLSHLTGQEADDGYRPPIVMCSALNGEGEADLWAAVVAHRQMLDTSGGRAQRRLHRIETEIRARLTQTLLSRVDQALASDQGRKLTHDVDQDGLSPVAAADLLLDQLRT
jgi:LAO/AO transport system kinase